MKRELLFATRCIASGTLVTGAATGFVGTLLLRKYIDDVKQVNDHAGMSFMWTLYSLTGLGLLLGLFVGIGTNAFYRTLANRENSSVTDSIE